MNYRTLVPVLAAAVLLPGIALASNFSKNMRSLELSRAASQSVTAPSSASLSPTGDLTLESWVKFNSYPSNGDAFVLIAKADNTAEGNSYTLGFEPDQGNDTIFFNIYNSSGGQSAIVNWSPTLDTWYHLAVAYDSTGVAKFYVNGTLIDTVTGLLTSIQATNAPFCIGHDCAGHYYFDGVVDEVRLYSAARSQSAIQSDYLHEVTGSETNLAAYWQLDKNLDDETDNHNDLTAVNGPAFLKDVPFAR